MKPACAFTIASDNYYYPCGTHLFINSFKRFHPDIDLVVFRQDKIDNIMQNGINFYNAKPTFAKQLTEVYSLVANIDADTIILDRLTEVFDTKYDVGAVWNLNDYENASFANITSEMYVQAGLVASRNKDFWDIWEEANKKANDYIRKENDVLNLVWYNDSKVQQMDKVIFDKDKNYLGCKSLGRESEFYMEGKKVMCRGEQVKAYHWAKGQDFPKLDFDRSDFPYEVKEYMKYVGNYGVTVTI
jgi:hypothetical protein